MLEYIAKFLMIFGVPILLVVFAIIILVNVVVVPHVRTAKSQKIMTNATVVDKREKEKASVYGFMTEYFVTFLFENSEKLELKCSKSLYKKVNIDDAGTLTYKQSVEIVHSFVITKKTPNKTKGKTQWSYSFSGDGVYKR